MAVSYVQMPADSSGKKLRTYDKGATGHDQYVIPNSERVYSGIYHAQTGAHVITAAADAATDGYWWLQNPLGSSVLVALERIHFMSQHGSALATLTSPRITIERFTFTGIAAGAQVTPAKRKTTDSANTATVRTAITGMVPAAGAAVIAFMPVNAITAVGACTPAESLWRPDEENQIVLVAGEGIICRQADAGTTSDTRRFVTNVAWSEFTLP